MRDRLDRIEPRTKSYHRPKYYPFRIRSRTQPSHPTASLATHANWLRSSTSQRRAMAALAIPLALATLHRRRPRLPLLGAAGGRTPSRLCAALFRRRSSLSSDPSRAFPAAGGTSSASRSAVKEPDEKRDAAPTFQQAIQRLQVLVALFVLSLVCVFWWTMPALL